jgi:DNA-binding XRE family transcriptional regulator
VSFQWARPKPYLESPQTLGEHLLKRRSERGLLQREAAAAIGVIEETYHLWENDRAFPTARLYRPVVAFLGYDPLPVGDGLSERLKRARWLKGLTIKEAAKLVGVNESTFGDWEIGKSAPSLHGSEIARFLAILDSKMNLS